MTKTEKEIMITALLENLTKAVWAKFHLLPEDWDGFEIRQWIQDVYNDRFVMKMDKKRMKNYLNDIRTNNII